MMFHEAWDRYKVLLRACPHHGFIELHQLDTFYNALNPADQDSLNSAAGGNLLERSTQDVLTIIENKSKIYVTCGGPFVIISCSPRWQTLLGIWDNIQGYVAAAAVSSQMNTASTSGTGSLPINTVANPRGELKAITTPKVVLVLMDLPTKDAYVSPSQQGRNVLNWKHTLNENCSAVILKKLTDKLGLHELISTQMTLELANRDIALQKELQEMSFVPVRKFTFPADFVIVDYESDPCVPSILGRYLFLRNALSALIDVMGKTATILLRSSPYELAHIHLTRNDGYPFDAESDLRDIEYLLNHDLIKDMDYILEDSIDENSLDDNLDDTISEMFTGEHALDYSSPPLWDDYDDNLFDHETDNDNVYDDPFDFKEEKIKESKLLIDELDLPESNNVLPFLECDSVFYEDFSEVDALSSTNNEEKVFNLVPGLGALLSFSSENEEKVFNPGILTSKRVYSSLLPELSHRGPKAFKVIKICESPMEIFPCSYQEASSLDVRVLHFYPLFGKSSMGAIGSASD
ncbi:hypothetical protein Tco_0038587 [Tanacetum coccineum]